MTRKGGLNRYATSLFKASPRHKDNRSEKIYRSTSNYWWDWPDARRLAQKSSPKVKRKRRQKFRSKARRETDIVVAIVIVVVVNIDVDAVAIRADQLIAQTLKNAPPIDPVRWSHGWILFGEVADFTLARDFASNSSPSITWCQPTRSPHEVWTRISVSTQCCTLYESQS